MDNTSEYTPSQETTSSLFIPQHRYNPRDLPSRRLSTDTSTLHLSAPSSNSALRLVRQHVQPLSSETHSSELVPSPYFASGFDTASLLSSDAQTAFLSGNFFSEVIIPTPVPAHVRLPEYYTADHSRPPTPNFADYPLRVDGITIYDSQNDPRFPFVAECFITNNDLLSHKRKKHLVSSPRDDKDRTYFTALYTQTYSYNELLFIAAKTISFMVQAEQKNEHKSHSSPIKNTPDKLSSVLNNRLLRDITNLLDPYKRNPSDTPITTLTHILYCYDRTHKLLQTLGLDSQRITQSSQAIQSALESITTLFNLTNLH